MATDQSNLEYANELDFLATIALIPREVPEVPEVPEPRGFLEVRAPSTVKRQNKKSSASFLTFENIKCMSGKTLIDKFTEMKSDEYTKKYSYKCMLLPESCSKTFKSFGNEKKAHDEVKMHILQHVDSLTEEYEFNNYTLDAVFVPISPCSSSKLVDKMAKKTLQKQHASDNSMLHRTNSSKTKKSPQKSGKRKFQESNGYAPELKNSHDRVKLKRSLNVKENSSTKLSNTASFCEERLIDKYSNQVSDSENYSNYNQYLMDFTIYNCTELNDSSSCLEQERNDSNSFDNYATSLGVSYFPNPHPCLQDHSYISAEGLKSDKFQEFKHVPHRNQNSFLSCRSKAMPFHIETPAFPYVHVPSFPNLGSVVELEVKAFQQRNSHPVFECGEIYYSVDPPVLKYEDTELASDDNLSDSEDRYELFNRGGSAASSSVLECVENIENKKHSSSGVPKNGISACENDENLEHDQKTERELALQFISEMHSKGKKKLTDSLYCKICPDKSFTAQATLLHHYRSHAGIKPYSCKLCSQKFTRQHSLNYHMLIHQNLSRFTCNVCERTFRHPSHFKEHMRRHTGETPFDCEECSLHFKTKNTFKRHMKTRHGKLITADGIVDLDSMKNG